MSLREHSSKPSPSQEQAFQQMIQAAFAEFNQKSLDLTEAYERLKSEIARVNLELEQKNTELSHTNQALDQAHAFLNNVFQSMTNGLLVLDERDEVLKSNASLSSILQVDTATWKGQFLQSVPLPEPLQKFVAVARKRGTQQHEAAIKISVQGEDHFLEVTGTFITETASRDLLLLIRDVTEVKDMRKQLIQNESLAGLGRLAVTVAHEIRNPLGGIEGFAALLKRDLAADTSHTKLLDKIIHGVRNLNDFITQLLTFAKVLEAAPKKVELRARIDKAILYSGQDPLHAPEGRLRFITQIPDGILLNTDPDLLQQMLLNLFLNAIDVVGVEGQVKIEVHDFPEGIKDHLGDARKVLESIHFRAGRRHICLRVADSGSGLDASVAEQMFQPFFTTKATGTGIGLSMVQKILEILEGRLEVRSPGELGGAEFYIYLPDLL